MMDREKLTAVITAFARYGFRKTSMDDVAKAMGISRQALYKKFPSKEAVFRAVLDELIASSAQGALAALRDEAAPVEDRILAAFDRWAGQYVDLLRVSPHSAEILDIASADMSEASRRAEDEIADAIAGLFGRRSMRTRNIAFALMMASKGMLMKANTRDDYVEGMTRVISVFTE